MECEKESPCPFDSHRLTLHSLWELCADNKLECPHFVKKIQKLVKRGYDMILIPDVSESLYNKLFKMTFKNEDDFKYFDIKRLNPDIVLKTANERYFKQNGGEIKLDDLKQKIKKHLGYYELFRRNPIHWWYLLKYPFDHLPVIKREFISNEKNDTEVAIHSLFKFKTINPDQHLDPWVSNKLFGSELNFVSD